MLLAIILALKKSLLHNLDQATKDTSLNVNSDKTEFVRFKQNRTIFILNGKPQKLVD